jgi:hypothetical protein
MQTRHRTLTVLATATVVAAFLAGPGWAQGGRRAPTTTVPVAPGQGPVPEGAVVNSWALAPAGASDPSQPGDRPSFSYAASAGETINDALTVFNFSNVPLTFSLYATDAFNNVDGQFDLLAEGQRPKDVGTWVELPQANLTLPAKTQATLPFTIAVPANARPGDHVGAILASNDATGVGPTGDMVDVDRRTGSRIYLRVAGPLDPELSITAVRTTYRHRLNPLSGKTDVTYRVENTGNVRMSGRHRATSSGIFGLGKKTGPVFTIHELLPGESVEFKASFTGIPATVVASSEAHVTATPVGEDDALDPVGRGSRALALPLAIMALAVIAGLVRYSRRSYRRHEVEQAQRERELQLQ